MKIPTLALTFCLLISLTTRGQQFRALADSIRQTYHIPALGYAVVSADSILEIQMLGDKKLHTPATLNDRFRIGSNTKAITAMVAALLVKKGAIKWDTKFFALYPELQSQSNPAYYNITLLQALTFRNKLPHYTYTNEAPTAAQIKGNEAQQRYAFAAWILAQPPVTDTAEINFSNAGYSLAGLMLEKVSHKTYKQLIRELGKQLHISFRFGNPNYPDSTQTWGHDRNGQPAPPANNYKLNWLLAAGNINVSLPGYTRFIQLQLKGLAGKSDLLTAAEFSFLHYGLPTFAAGWFWQYNEANHLVSQNTGNPGTFITEVHIIKEADRAYIFFTNVQRDDVYEGLTILREALEKQYGN
ncbi:CubicO group peptidase (beta-lactamase class C family) [Chitinophaga niastensis]|uniref:CubicO group peptidase (Beta-lactamase class C family) n=1 Tax=Chitinophaga niastensis TaxID=536980 RepID=A0A2P8HIJ1_CHINA|nr:serine hydrolase domain-containing protein [Chitinophaga niastensis]PSL46038.1 CubicO group peptidase (beta-lactamase class C family) [Chitinophaga niastensis]